MSSDDSHHGAVPVGCPTFTDRADCLVKALEDIAALVDPAAELVAALGNASSVLFYSLNAHADSSAKLHELVVNWCGFYLLHSPTELRLGPFQGKVACQSIKVGKGVCGTSVLKKCHTAVPDVHAVPGHIACDAGSNSEIVVLIRTPDGRIVGLLDVDSTQVGFFSDADIAPLEKICVHIGRAMAGKFPIEQPTAITAGSVNQTDAFAVRQLPTRIPAFQVTQHPTAARSPGGVQQHIVHHPPAAAKAALAGPKTDVVEVRGWEFQSILHDLMLASQAFPEIESRLDVKLMPEVIFADNLLNFVCPLLAEPPAANTKPARAGTTRIVIKALDAIACASDFYKSGRIASVANLHVPASSSWDKYRETMHSLDPKIDWSFRSDYVGDFEFVPNDGASHPHVVKMPLVAADPANPAHRIDYEMLKREDLPIRFYSAMDLFEDDLHDSGMSKLTVKARAMDTCFFVLMRHLVRVDGVALILRDVRIFHAFGSAHVVVEEVTRDLWVEATLAAARPPIDREDLRRRMARGEGDCAELLKTVFASTRIVTLPAAPAAVAGA